MVERNMGEKPSFTADIETSVGSAGIVFICVDNPQKANGEAHLSSLETVLQRTAKAMRDNCKLIVEGGSKRANTFTRERTARITLNVLEEVS